MVSLKRSRKVGSFLSISANHCVKTEGTVDSGYPGHLLQHMLFLAFELNTFEYVSVYVGIHKNACSTCPDSGGC